jgi:hypothetical protein
MKKPVVYISVSFIMLLLCFISSSLAIQPSGNTCVKCHTNDSTLKMLFIPPNVPVSEGEG